MNQYNIHKSIMDEFAQNLKNIVKETELEIKDDLQKAKDTKLKELIKENEELKQEIKRLKALAGE